MRKGRGRLHTVLVFVCSFAVVFCGWFVTAGLLNRREEKFLAQAGQVALKPSQIALFTEEGMQGEGQGTGRTVEKEVFRGVKMTEITRALILSVWEYGGSELPHEPEAGQMSMEQAIDAGRDWIGSVAGYWVIPEKLAEDGFDKISATLCTLDSQLIVTGLDDFLLSYWTVRFEKSDSIVTLKIHAASGEVWRAEIAMEQDEGIVENYGADNLLDIAFPFMKEDGESRKMWKDLENSTTYQCADKGMVYASAKQYEIYYMGELDHAASVVEFWLCTGNFAVMTQLSRKSDTTPG